MRKGEEKLEKNIQQKKKDFKPKEVAWFLIRILLICGFVGISIFGNITHERWGDEAQAWLLARDASVSDIIFTYASQEGSPVLWHLILKVAITLGLNYSFYGIIPLVFSVIGLILLEFKLKLPWYLKLLIPFTYYILYQYNIVARSYCLLFPALCYLAMVYPNRREKPAQYAIGLALLSSICLHGCILSGTLFLLYFMEYLTRRMKEEKSLRSFFKEKKVWIPFLILGLFYCFLIFTLIPRTTPQIQPAVGEIDLFEKTIEIMGEASISSKVTQDWANVVGSIWTIIITVLLTIRAKKEERKIWVLLLLTLAFLVFYYCNAWHVGILTLTFFFVWYILYQGKTEKMKQWEKVVLLISIIFLLIMQIMWSVKAFIEESKQSYSLGQSMAESLKEPVEQGKKIYGVDYSVTAILPYYEKNIFANFPNKDHSFYHWVAQDGTIRRTDELVAGEADIYVISEAYLPYYLTLVQKLEDKGYEAVRYTSALLVKGNTYEYSGYVIMQKPE